jgi:hypothetical protein
VAVPAERSTLVPAHGRDTTSGSAHTPAVFSTVTATLHEGEAVAGAFLDHGGTSLIARVGQ